MKKHPNVGSSLDDFLDDEGVRAEVDAAATKRVIALQIADAMRRQKVTKSALARRMGTSRAAIDRLLDASSASVTLVTLERVASALHRRLKVDLVPEHSGA